MAITAEPETIPAWSLADRLGKSLEASPMTKRSMAAVLEVHPNTIGNYLNGSTAPTAATLRVWSIETRVPLEWLRGESPICSECGNIRSRCFCASAQVSVSPDQLELAGMHSRLREPFEHGGRPT